MALFLIDNDKEYSYEDLLISLNKSNYYFPLYKSNDLYLFFTNLVKAVITNKPLILVDSDLNINEIGGINENLVNVPEEIQLIQYKSIENVIKALQISSSEITIFTSGTTGQPKKVIHNMQTLTRNVRATEKYIGQKWAFAYNPTHMAGLQVFFQAFENKNMLINVFNQRRSEVYKIIDNYQITHISATPTFYRLLLPFEKSYSSVVRVTLGGEKSDSHLYDNILKIFPSARINNVYASTEAGTLFSTKEDCFQIPEQIKDKIIVKNEELLIHKSLLGKSESFLFDDDYYHSGDIIEWVNKEERLFKFKSRKNELINVGGYKINPTEVESILLAIDGIQQVIVYGKVNSVLGNILCADIKLEKGIQLTDMEIKRILSSQLQDFKIPRRIKFVENMQLTRTGKLKRS